MKLLPDTHLLLWLADGSPELPAAAQALMGDLDNDVVFSVASLWEVAIKFALGRPEFQVDPRLLRRGLLDNGYAELTITARHALATGALPSIHKDPFDRLLIAQATVEGITLLTVDATLLRYPGPIRRI